MYHTCRCTINSKAVSLFVYSLVGGGTHTPTKTKISRTHAQTRRFFFLDVAIRNSLRSNKLFHTIITSNGSNILVQRGRFTAASRDTHTHPLNTAYPHLGLVPGADQGGSHAPPDVCPRLLRGSQDIELRATLELR